MFGFFGIGQRRKARHDEEQSEMVPVALNSVLRRRGMSPQSISCELVHLSRPGAASVALVKLQIRAWSERLMQEAGDLEAELLDVICLYSRSQRKTEYIIVWKFAIEPGEAGPKAPAVSTPGVAAPARLTAVPDSVAVVKFDLPKSALDESESHYEYGFPATVIRNP